MFFSELSSLTEHFEICSMQMVIAGDLDLHLEDQNRLEQFCSIAQEFGLIQYVAELTRDHEVWLDIIVTRDDCVTVDWHITLLALSHYGLVSLTILKRSQSLSLGTAVDGRNWVVLSVWFGYTMNRLNACCVKLLDLSAFPNFTKSCILCLMYLIACLLPSQCTEFKIQYTLIVFGDE